MTTMNELAGEAREFNNLFKHLEIVNQLSKCKVATVKDLYKWTKANKSYEAFRRLIIRLEKAGILDSVNFSSNQQKYVYVKDGIKKKFWNESSGSLDKKNLFHDAMCSRLMMSLKEQGFIDFFALDHDLDSVSHIFKNLGQIVPDSVGFSKKLNLKMIFEFEIHQKSRNRIFEKLSQILICKEIDKAFYFIPSKAVYQNYTLRLIEFYNLSDERLQDLIKEKVFLVYSEKMVEGDFLVSNYSEFNLSGKKFFNIGAH